MVPPEYACMQTRRRKQARGGVGVGVGSSWKQSQAFSVQIQQPAEQGNPTAHEMGLIFQTACWLVLFPTKQKICITVWGLEFIFPPSPIMPQGSRTGCPWRKALPGLLWIIVYACSIRERQPSVSPYHSNTGLLFVKGHLKWILITWSPRPVSVLWTYR